MIPGPLLVRYSRGFCWRCPDCGMRYYSVISYQNHYREIHEAEE
jgi:hypothetical protein